MADNENELIRVSDTEARAMLRQLAEMDLRAMGNEVAWLIRQEWARRFSQPNPSITLGEAIQAGQSITSIVEDK